MSVDFTPEELAVVLDAPNTLEAAIAVEAMRCTDDITEFLGGQA